jgi:hypothetical protein
VLIEASVDIDDRSSYRPEVLTSLLVVCSNIVVSDEIVENVDGYIEVLRVVMG